MTKTILNSVLGGDYPTLNTLKLAVGAMVMDAVTARQELLLARALTSAHFGFAVARVAVKRARWRELAELVIDHVLGHEDGDKLAAVVHVKRESDCVWRNGRAT